jgi:hypothetical protein
VLKREIDKFQELIEEGRAFGALDHPECFRDTAKVLTSKNGWKYIKDVLIGEEVLSLNIKTEQIESKKVTKVIYQDYSGEMIKFDSRNLRTIVTPNHKMLVKKHDIYSYITAEELFEDYKFKSLKYIGFGKYKDKFGNIIKRCKGKNLIRDYNIPKIGTWAGIETDKFIFPGIEKENLKEKNKYAWKKRQYTEEELEKFSEDLVVDVDTYTGFIGLYLSEGSSNSGKNLLISQSNKDSYPQNKVKDFFKNLPNEIDWEYDGNHYYKIKDPRIGYYFSDKEFGNNVYDKKIPINIKQYSSNILEKIFNWFNIGDGRRHMSNNSPRDIFSVSEQLIDDLHEIYIKIGKSGNRKIYKTIKDYFYVNHIIKAENKKPLHVFNCSSQNIVTLSCLDISKEYYNGKISCLEVEDNHNFYVMDDRTTFWTGNSSIVELNNACHLIKKMYFDGNKVLIETQVLDTDSGKNLKAILKAGGKVGISSRSYGSTTAIDEETEQVNDDLSLLTGDIVSQPSVKSAILSESLIYKHKKLINENPKLNKINEILDYIQREF